MCGRTEHHRQHTYYAILFRDVIGDGTTWASKHEVTTPAASMRTPAAQEKLRVSPETTAKRIRSRQLFTDTIAKWTSDYSRPNAIASCGGIVASSDDARRQALAQAPIAAGVGILAKLVTAAPRKRADAVPKRSPTPKATAKAMKPNLVDDPKKPKNTKSRNGEPVAAPQKKCTSRTESKKSPCHRAKVRAPLSTTRKCTMSRAFHAEEKRARAEGWSEEVVKQRRRKAFAEAGAKWDLENGRQA